MGKTKVIHKKLTIKEKNMANFKRIAVVADHRGEGYVPTAKKIIEGLGVECIVPTYDSGAENDYPDVVKSVGDFLHVERLTAWFYFAERALA
jgi:ribosomal protein L19